MAKAQLLFCTKGGSAGSSHAQPMGWLYALSLVSIPGESARSSLLIRMMNLHLCWLFISPLEMFCCLPLPHCYNLSWRSAKPIAPRHFPFPFQQCSNSMQFEKPRGPTRIVDLSTAEFVSRVMHLEKALPVVRIKVP